MPQYLGINPYPNDIDVNQPLLTLNDAVVHLSERNGGFSDDPRGDRMYARAVRDVLRDLPSKNRWNYYRRNLQFVTSAPVVLSSVTSSVAVPAGEFDGNLLRLQITNAETWPDDVADGEVWIDNVSYPVGKHDTATKTIIVNRPTLAFSGEIKWTRKAYKIPRVRQVLGMWDIESRRPILPRRAQDLSDRTLTHNAPGTVTAYTIRQDSSYGMTDVVLSPPPSESSPFLVMSVIEPLYPKIVRKTLDGADATIVSPNVFSHADANESWVGGVLRIHESSTDETTDLQFGEYTWQSIIWGVDGQNVTMSNPFPSSVAAKEILLSSLIDIDLPVLQTYFEALCHEYYGRNSPNSETQAVARATAAQLFLEASGADAKFDASTKYHPFWSYGADMFSETDFPTVIK